MPKPNFADVPVYYHNYINKVQEDDLLKALHQHKNEFQFFQNITDEKWDYRYAAGKWSIKELVQHVIDAERIFSYRALCIARNDKTPLPSFDENQYAAASKADKRSKGDLLAELQAVQTATVALFASFDAEQLSTTGIANNKPVSVNAIGFILIGHTRHHLDIVRGRYL